MNLLDMRDYTKAARAYWWTTVAIGYAALAWTLGEVASQDAGVQVQVFTLAAAAAIVGLVPVRIPGTKMSVAAGEIFIFLALLLHGPYAAVLAAALEGLVASWRTSKRWTSRIVTPALIGIAMLACASAFEAARAAIESAGAGATPLLLAFLAFGIAYFMANTALTSTLLALKRSEPILPLRWWIDMTWIGLAYATSAVIAGLLFASFQHFGVSVLAVAVPTICMFLYALHAHFARREAEQRHLAQLAASESRFHSAFTHAAIGMALLDADGRILQSNKSFGEMLGRAVDDTSGRLQELVHPADFAGLQASIDRLVRGEALSIQAEVRGIRGDGTDVWMALNVSLARDWQAQAPNLIVQAQDVTARRRAEAELYHNAFHDSLTGLANRQRFAEQLTRALALWQRHTDRHFAVMYLDFDRFKLVNDSLGHRAGDELLIELARRVSSALRPRDLVARLGGDEFAILVTDLESDRQAIELAERLLRQVARPFTLAGIEVALTASIGITFSSNGYTSADQVVRDADIAMYQAKERGRAQYALFDNSLHRLVSGQLKLESQLRHAVHARELFVVYQPVHALADNALVGFEALVRWRHPEHGVINPALFIPLAEQTGLIAALGQQVMQTACRQLRAWEAESGARNLRMSVNVSALELRQPDFVDNVRRCLDDCGIEPRQLVIEVTETVLLDNVSNAVPTLGALRALGVAIGIDDFGTGYSSLGYLSSLPVDVIKLDRCFVEPLGACAERDGIAKAILEMARALDKQVVAEGVEKPEQLAMLRELSCRYAQGYLFSRPLESQSAGDLIRASRRPVSFA